MKVSAFQVNPEPCNAGVKWKPGRDPAFRPVTPASDGPIPFTPGWLEWQAEHCAWEISLPAPTSSPAHTGGAKAIGVRLWGKQRRDICITDLIMRELLPGDLRALAPGQIAT